MKILIYFFFFVFIVSCHKETNIFLEGTIDNPKINGKSLPRIGMRIFTNGGSSDSTYSVYINHNSANNDTLDELLIFSFKKIKKTKYLVVQIIVNCFSQLVKIL